MGLSFLRKGGGGMSVDHFTIKAPVLSDRRDYFLPVTKDSPLRHRKVVEQLAYYFKREFHYDFVQYSATHDDDLAEAYLWRDHQWADSPIIGGCCFRPDGKGWRLCWVWFHPYCRRRGLLSARWSFFQERYGHFFCERPLSEAMESFLAQIGHYEIYEDKRGTYFLGIPHGAQNGGANEKA
jgi:hypothetical protein